MKKILGAIMVLTPVFTAFAGGVVLVGWFIPLLIFCVIIGMCSLVIGGLVLLDDD